MYIILYRKLYLVNYKKTTQVPDPSPTVNITRLESSIFPFKSITLKGIIKIIIFSITFFYIKSFIYPILIDNLTSNMLKIHVIGSVLTYFIGNIFNESFDYIVKDINFNLFQNINTFDLNKNLNNNMESEGSSKRGESSKAGESYKTGESSKQGRVITDSDYESDSEYESSTKNPHPYSDQNEDGESDISKLINANLPEFKKVTKTLTNDELVDVMGVIDYAREEYRASNVPSAKTQIENLNIKENICASQLEENLKDKETVKDKGKGKAKEQDDT